MSTASTGDVHQRLTAIFHDLFNDEAIEITDATTASDIPGWDSFNHINLMMMVESEFKIRMKNSEITHLKNVGELVGLIVTKSA